MNEFQERIGVGKPSYIGLRHAGTSRTKPVISEEGRSRGKTNGSITEHWDGKVDAKVRPDSIRVTASKSTKEIVSIDK